MGERYINFDLDDPRADKLAEALSNKTCKKILGLLVEKDMNASEISSALKLPLNTIGYNLEKLIEAGLIEKSSGVLWSVKGKKIEKYRISSRKIIISPRKVGMSVIPVLVISGIIAFLLKFIFGFSQREAMGGNLAPSYGDAALQKSSETAIARSSEIIEFAAEDAASEGGQKAAYEGYNLLVNFGYEWLWFLLGSIIGLIIFLVWNRRKIWG
ncbi:MAG: helix-turn-helix domain-containing protein [Nanoarchaeota archaeon]|nr:helix-turn-helix domain-containing protein [Nanoarchaeota archaeon]